MRTKIEIDEALVSEAMELADLPTRQVAVEEGLKLLVLVRRQADALADLKGLGWDDDLHQGDREIDGSRGNLRSSQ